MPTWLKEEHTADIKSIWITVFHYKRSFSTAQTQSHDCQCLISMYRHCSCLILKRVICYPDQFNAQLPPDLD